MVRNQASLPFQRVWCSTGPLQARSLHTSVQQVIKGCDFCCKLGKLSHSIASCLASDERTVHIGGDGC